MAKNQDGYLSAKESRRISKENRRITDQYEKRRKRRNVPESEYTTQMKDPANAVEFDNLHTYFFTDTGVVKSVDGVSFEVPIGKTVGVVGESGCGKSVTSLSLMQLLQRPQGQIVEGAIRLNLGNDKAYDIAKTPADKMQGLRGNYISMIFQEPMTSLNPVFRIGAQIDEVIALHEGEGKTKEDIKKRTIEMLEMVGIANSEGVYAGGDRLENENTQGKSAGCAVTAFWMAQFARAVDNHFTADDPKQKQRNPMVGKSDCLAESAPGKISGDRHEHLEQAKGSGRRKRLLPAKATVTHAVGNGDGKCVHGESQSDHKERECSHAVKDPFIL